MSTHKDRVADAIKDAVKTEEEAVETKGPYIKGSGRNRPSVQIEVPYVLVCTGYEPPSDTRKRKPIC